MQTNLAAVGSRLVDSMNLEDSRPTTLLEGDEIEEVLSSISTVKIEPHPPGSISRAVICDPVGRAIDAPYVIHDEAGLILLHLCQEKPDYLSSLARNLSKKDGSVRDASLVISRFFQDERGSDLSDGILIREIGIESNFRIRISSDEGSDESSDLSLLHFSLAQGGLTEYHLGGRFLPHEIGLSDFVRLENGCYPGQEIHARLDSRNPVTKRLVRIRCEGALEKGRLVTEDGKLKIITPIADFYAHAIADEGVLDGVINHKGMDVEISTIHSAF